MNDYNEKRFLDRMNLKLDTLKMQVENVLSALETSTIALECALETGKLPDGY